MIKILIGTIASILLIITGRLTAPLTKSYEYGFDAGVRHEQALTDHCRKKIGNDYDAMVYCIEALYGDEWSSDIYADGVDDAETLRWQL